MSDDLERAERLERAWTRYERAALLSFLDMDEAGFARVAQALWDSSSEAKNITSEDSRRALRNVVHAQARAVLSELRKMAGEKDG